MIFTDPLKYVLLAIVIVFLLGAIGILAWQAFNCFVHIQAHENAEDVGDTSSKEKHPKQQYSEVEDVNIDRFTLPQSTLSASEYSLLNGDMEEEPVKVGGFLRFSVQYDQLQSRLVVTFLQMEGLQQQWHSSNFQLFVKVLLLWDKYQGAEMEVYQDVKDQQKACVLWTVIKEWRSYIVRDGFSPVFEDQFSSLLQEDIRPQQILLKMQVRNFDEFSRHTALGEVRLPLKELNISTPLELLKELQIPQKDLVGELLLSLNLLPTTQRLEVGLLKAKVALVNSSSKTALFARISVTCNQYRQKSQKSSVVAYGFVTVFNEVFYFTMPEDPLMQCRISVSVFEKEVMTRKSPKRLIGQVILGKEKTCEDKHWTLMMRSARHPVALWHGLLI
ncbi:hypothetical protein WMY93_023908 [Mugilogobius chulae]|uniref:C2 domain-containing protein n=1 Tax=Mugilogobius chulae TaxID=88201 RepID=A0AAW0NGM9_9GOBI